MNRILSSLIKILSGSKVEVADHSQPLSQWHSSRGCGFAPAVGGEPGYFLCCSPVLGASHHHWFTSFLWLHTVKCDLVKQQKAQIFSSKIQLLSQNSRFQKKVNKNIICPILTLLTFLWYGLRSLKVKRKKLIYVVLYTNRQNKVKMKRLTTVLHHRNIIDYGMSYLCFFRNLTPWIHPKESNLCLLK